ncbi:MAG: hypothetical protein ACE5KM_14665 [Planctomycetaceae bacterium]
MSIVVGLADAVVNELNAGSFSQSFNAVRDYLPLYELKELKSLRVTVVPSGTAIETKARKTAQHDVEIDIAVQQKLADTDNATVDPLMTVTEEIADHFRFKRLASPDAVWIKTENEPVFAQEHLDQYRVFTSLVTLTFRILR